MTGLGAGGTEDRAGCVAMVPLDAWSLADTVLAPGVALCLLGLVLYLLARHRAAARRTRAAADLLLRAARSDSVLKRSEDRLARAQRIAHIGSFEWTFGESSVCASEELDRIFGRSERGVPPGAERSAPIREFLDQVHPDDRDRVERLVSAITAGTGAIPDIEFRVRRPDGTVRHVHAVGEVGTGAGGIAQRMIGTVQDVTDRVRSEQERAELEVRLRQAHKMEALGTLAGGVAHEFNNVLTAIFGFAEFTKEDLPAGSEARQNVEQILAAAARARQLIEQILGFSRRRAPRLRRIDTAAVVRDAVRFVCATLPPWIELRCDLAGDVAPIEADETQLHQLLLNLGSNAVHAMRGQSGVLEVGLGDVDVDQELARLCGTLEPGRAVLLTVRDSGCGMDAATRERIFDPFFTTKRRGNGLGLSILHGIVQRHGGAVRVDSAPAAGTTFRIYFPVAATPTTAATPVADGSLVIPTPARGQPAAAVRRVSQPTAAPLPR